MNNYDKDTVEKVNAFFRSHGYETQVTEDPFDPFDLVLKTTKGDVAVEIKGRNVPSYTYPTMAVDIGKWKAALQAISSGRYRSAILACVYMDGILGLGYLDKGKAAVAEGPASTCFDRQYQKIKEYWDVDFACRIPLDSPKTESVNLDGMGD